MRQLLKKYRQHDRELAEARSREEQKLIFLLQSDGVYLLQKYRWLILSNRSNITYHSTPRMDPHFRCLMNTYDYEDTLFRLAPKLRDFRNLKEKYIQFNHQNTEKPLEARNELDELIPMYQTSEYEIFRTFGGLLEKYQDYIINSFIMVEKYGYGKVYESRLSNGPIESINRKVKDLKRLGRSLRNFEHFRNRFLYAAEQESALNSNSNHNPVLYFDNDDDN